MIHDYTEEELTQLVDLCREEPQHDSETVCRQFALKASTEIPKLVEALRTSRKDVQRAFFQMSLLQEE